MIAAPDPAADPAGGPTLARSLGLWQATAINITQIVGSGVFVTVPMILGVLPGAYGLLAWLVAGVLIIADGMIWGELGAALPAAGGTYHFLLECYGRSRWGRLMGFLFIWQILISGPLELASGLGAVAKFTTGLSPELKEFNEAHTWRFGIPIGEEEKRKLPERVRAAAAAQGTLADLESSQQSLEVSVNPGRVVGLAVGLAVLVLLYRRVTTLGRISMVFMAGVVGILGWVIIEGALRFRPELAFDTNLRPDEQPAAGFGPGLGLAMGFALYSYFGYYNVCYLGAEVRDPAKTIPRSILLSAGLVIVLFLLTHLALTGVIPWWEAAASTNNLTADFMTRIHGPWAAVLVTVLLLGSCFASTFSGALGYSRVPYAAAKEGHFFRWFAAVHPTLRIPHRSLLLVGGMMLCWSFFSLEAVITALIATRILEQFVAQVFAVVLLRHLQPERPRPWRMWLYPLPCFVALTGWMFVYLNTGRLYVLLGACTLVVGVVVYFIWAKRQGVWPFPGPR